MKRRLPILAVAGAVALVVASPAGGASTENVRIGDFVYVAKRVRIDPGDTVTWTNRDDILHTVTSVRTVPERFDSGLRDTGQAFTKTFAKPGTYDYYCTIHGPNVMSGVVQVGPDTVKPVVSRTRVRVGSKLRFSFRLSERSSVAVTITRGGKVVRRLKPKRLDRGSRSLTTKVPGAGRYRASIRAIDLEKNRSKSTRVGFRVRG